MKQRASPTAWLLILLCARSATLPSSEEAALLVIYEALGGPDWWINRHNLRRQ